MAFVESYVTAPTLTISYVLFHLILEISGVENQFAEGQIHGCCTIINTIQDLSSLFEGEGPSKTLKSAQI